jgi:hypothetical protein
MLLGLHTYSLHLHGMGQNWGGFELGLTCPRLLYQFQSYTWIETRG